VPEEILEAEKKIYQAQAAEEGKPEAIQEKIAEGRLNKEFYQAACLMDQPFVKEQKQTIDQLVKEAIAKLGENIQVKRFTRYKVGEE
jgi:elongation factor Ts